MAKAAQKTAQKTTARAKTLKVGEKPKTVTITSEQRARKRKLEAKRSLTPAEKRELSDLMKLFEQLRAYDRWRAQNKRGDSKPTKSAPAKRAAAKSKAKSKTPVEDDSSDVAGALIVQLREALLAQAKDNLIKQLSLAFGGGSDDE